MVPRQSETTYTRVDGQGFAGTVRFGFGLAQIYQYDRRRIVCLFDCEHDEPFANDRVKSAPICQGSQSCLIVQQDPGTNSIFGTYRGTQDGWSRTNAASAVILGNHSKHRVTQSTTARDCPDDTCVLPLPTSAFVSLGSRSLAREKQQSAHCSRAPAWLFCPSIRYSPNLESHIS